MKYILYDFPMSYIKYQTILEIPKYKCQQDDKFDRTLDVK